VHHQVPWRDLYRRRECGRVRVRPLGNLWVVSPFSLRFCQLMPSSRLRFMRDLSDAHHKRLTDVIKLMSLIRPDGFLIPSSQCLHRVVASRRRPRSQGTAQPADSSSIAASTGPAQFVPVSQVTAVQDQLQAVQSRIVQTIDEYKDSYRGQWKFDYRLPLQTERSSLQYCLYFSRRSFYLHQIGCAGEVHVIRGPRRRSP
jgi:hypothetical protein